MTVRQIPLRLANDLPIVRHIGYVMIVLVPAAFALRSYVKLGILKRWKGEDWALLMAVLLYIPICVIYTRFEGWILSLFGGQLNLTSKIETSDAVANCLYGLSAACAKISVALMTLSYLGTNARRQKYIIYGLTVLVISVAVVYVSFSFTCGTKGIVVYQRAYCATHKSAVAVSIAWSIVNMIADIGFAILCVNIVWTTQMSLTTRIVASSLLALCSSGAIISILRTATLFGWQSTTSDGQKMETNKYSILEAGLCIVCVCLSALRPLMRLIKNGKHGSIPGGTSRRGRDGTAGPSMYTATVTALGVGDMDLLPPGHNLRGDDNKKHPGGVTVDVTVDITEVTLDESNGKDNAGTMNKVQSNIKGGRDILESRGHVLDSDLVAEHHSEKGAFDSDDMV